MIAEKITLWIHHSDLFFAQKLKEQILLSVGESKKHLRIKIVALLNEYKEFFEKEKPPYPKHLFIFDLNDEILDWFFEQDLKPDAVIFISQRSHFAIPNEILEANIDCFLKRDLHTKFVKAISQKIHSKVTEIMNTPKKFSALEKRFLKNLAPLFFDFQNTFYQSASLGTDQKKALLESIAKMESLVSKAHQKHHSELMDIYKILSEDKIKSTIKLKNQIRDWMKKLESSMEEFREKYAS